jgi:hypothetical protein
VSAFVRHIETDDGPGTVDDQGRLRIDTPDGGIIIRTQWRRAESPGETRKHTSNLADGLSDTALGVLADEILRGIDADKLSRQEWLLGLADSVEMLGLRLKKSGASADDSAAPLEGMSTFDHPLLLQASIRFQADFVTEMLPADGPVKVRSDATAPPVPPAGIPGIGDNNPPEPIEQETEDDLAQDLEKDFNHYLTDTATEYYPDTTRMAFRVGLMGGGFKKVFDCPLRLRPVSESIEISDLIVDHSATDIQNASLVGRVTHRIRMQNSMLKRMIKAGVYRDVRDDLVEPHENPDVLEIAERRVQGLSQFSALPSDHPHTIYECSTGLDPEDVGDSGGDGTYRPYKVTIEETSRTILAIRRNWAEDDKLKMPRREYVKYSYIDALGFYPIGLIHILGNVVRALTAAYREMLDAGMFASFPGFLYSESGGRQLTNKFRVAPGSGAPIQTGGKPISDMVMPLPYRMPDASWMQFIQHLEESGKSLGGEVSAPLNEGKANMPVGTMLAAIEQAVKPLKGVFKGLHRSQAEEFQLLRERFKENPEALWRYNERPSRQWQVDEFQKALADCNLVPMADPNTMSQVQRVIIASAVEALAEKAPILFKLRDTAQGVMRMYSVPDGGEQYLDTEENIQAKMAQQAQQGQKGPAGQDPQLSAAKTQEAQARTQLAQAQTQQTVAETQGAGSELQDKAADRQAKAASEVVESQDREADRQSHLQIAQMRLQSDQQKTGAGMATKAVEHQSDAIEGDKQRAHEAGMAAETHQHEAGLAANQAVQTAMQGDAQREHESGMAQDQAVQSSIDGGEQRKHEVKVAGMGAARAKKGKTNG